MMQKYDFVLQDSDTEEKGSQVKLVDQFSPKKKGKRHIILACVLLVLLAIALGVGLGIGLNRSKENKSENMNTPAAQVGGTNQPSTGKTTPQSTTKPSSTTKPHTWIELPCMPPGGESHKCPWKKNPLLLFSLDGFRADYLTRNMTPTIQKLSTCGVHTPYMRSVYPTLTFPNHYTIVTGLYPESHGIVNNNMYDPIINKTFTLYGTEKSDPKWWGGEPIWITAKKQGKRSAAYFWVGTDVNITGQYPDVWNAYDGKITFEARIDTALEWLSLPEHKRPDLILLYVNEPDHTGHGYGPDKEEVDEMLVKVDKLISRLMNGLYQKQLHNCVNMMIMADHGMEDTSCDRKVLLNNYINIKDKLIFDGTIGTIHENYHASTKKDSDVVLKNTQDTTTSKLLESLNCKSAHLNIYSKSTMPVRHHYTNNIRLGDVTVDVQAKWIVVRDKSSHCLEGNHGFDNLYKSMQALFLAHGPDFKQNIKTEPFENIELYNTMCDLLGIKPAPNNGTLGALSHILHNPTLVSHERTQINYQQCSNQQGTVDASACNCQIQSRKLTTLKMSSSPFGEPRLSEHIESCKLQNGPYTSGYSWQHKMPVWSSFVLIDIQTFSNISGEFCPIKDSRIPSKASASCSDYENRSKEISYVFLYHPNFENKLNSSEAQLNTNLVPMYEGFKTGIWQYLWRLISDFNSQEGDLSVTIGPAFDNNHDGMYDTINQTRDGTDDVVPVPTHFYVILMKCKDSTLQLDLCQEQDIQILSFILPHVPTVSNCMPEEHYLKENVARIRDIELLTGLQFLTNMSHEQSTRLRTFLPTSLWPTTNIVYSWADLPCDGGDQSQCPGKIPLLLISLDGFRAEYLERKLTPVIQKLRNCGVHAPYMRSVYPTVTFPNHYTIVTGLYPESHGIISNKMYDEDIGEVFTIGGTSKANPRWWGGEPLWITAKKQGKKTATFFWPGSDVNISGVYPDMWKLYDGKVGYPERVYTIIDWLTLPEGEKPDFVTLYFDQPDHIAHSTGPDDGQVNAQLQTVDDMLLRLMDALYHKGLHNCVNIIVIADHGFDHTSCSQLVKLPNYITNITDLLIFDGTFGRIQPQFHRLKETGRDKYIVFPNDYVRPAEMIVDELMCKHKEMKVFTKDTVPRRHHYFNNPRMGDILLDVADQWLVTRTNSYFCFGGNHGWDNLYKAMHALFLAHGPAFKKKIQTDSFENIELYNLMCEILGITPAPNNGTFGSLHHILDNPKPLPRQNDNRNPHFCNQTSGKVLEFGNSCSKENMTHLNPVSVSEAVTVSLPFGVPHNKGQDICMAAYKNLISGFDERMLLPRWSASILKRNKKGPNLLNKKECMVTDRRISASDINDYIDTNRNITFGYLYQSDFVYPDADMAIFIDSNSVPMYYSFKNGIWKSLFGIIKEYNEKFGDISVITGPAYDNDGDALADSLTDLSNITVHANSSIPLPTHYFVILTKCSNGSDILPCKTGVDVQSFILPHTDGIPNCLSDKDFLQDNVARVKDVELLTGLEFFTKNYSISEHARLQTYLPVKIWPSPLTETWLDTNCETADEKCSSEYQPLLLISLDGFRADYLLRNLTPNIKRFLKCGVHAPYMRSVFPTKTFPNHYSIVTGLYPESHGIIDNNMYDKNIGERFGLGKPNASDPRWWGGDPIWNTVRKHNKTSATFFWPGSDVEVNGMYPNYWKKYDGDVTYSDRVQQILKWMDMPSESRPDFMTLYFEEPDKQGHIVGPDDTKINLALAKVDKAIGELMEGLLTRQLHNCVNIIIIADHGMADTSCNRLITFMDYLTSTYNKYIYDGPFGRINPNYRYSSGKIVPVENPDNVSSIMANLTCHPHFKAYRKEELPVRYHYVNNDRIDPIVIDVEDKWLVTYRSLSRYGERYCSGGNHGYDNRYKSMRALFLAHGPEFRQNVTVNAFENIELYNLMTDILKIKASPNNGTRGSLNHVLRSPPVHAVELSHPYRNANQNFTVADYLRLVNNSDCSTVCPTVLPEKKHEIAALLYMSSMMTHPDVTSMLPHGLPRLMTDANVSVLYQPMFVTGYGPDIQSPLWIAFSFPKVMLVQDKKNNVSGCILPDIRVSTQNNRCTRNQSEIGGKYTMTSLLNQVYISGYGFISLSGEGSLKALRVVDEEVFDRRKDVGMSLLSTTYVPMLKEFYKGVWVHLHQLLKEWHSIFKDLKVIVGPIYEKSYDVPSHVIGNVDKVKIPSHFFMIILRCKVQQGGSCEDFTPLSFILPHRTDVTNCQNYNEYLTDNEARIRDIELMTGFEFFHNLKVEKALELRTFLPNRLWTL